MCNLLIHSILQIGGGKFESSLLNKIINTSLRQTGRALSLAMMLCLSAFFVSIPLDASAKGKRKKPKTTTTTKTTKPLTVNPKKGNLKQL